MNFDILIKEAKINKRIRKKIPKQVIKKKEKMQKNEKRCVWRLCGQGAPNLIENFVFYVFSEGILVCCKNCCVFFVFKIFS